MNLFSFPLTQCQGGRVDVFTVNRLV